MHIDNGLTGGIVIDDTSKHDGTFSVLKALGGDVVFSAVSGNINDLAGTTLSNGDFIVGYFTSVTLTSGTLVAYLAKTPSA